jgi:hypothetical protein
MDSSSRRVATRFVDSAQFQALEGPMTAYADWLDNNPAVAKVTTMSPTLSRQLRLKFRAFPAAFKFFALTDQIHHMSLGAPMEDLSLEFRQAAKFLSQAVIRVMGDERGAEIANAITDCAVDNAVNLRRIGAGAQGQLFTKVGTSIALVLEKLSRGLGLSAGYRMVTVEGTRWPQVRILTKREEALKALQANNPQMYEEITANSEQAAKAIAGAHKAITESGLVPTTVSVDGVEIPAGEEYVSKEKIVFPPEGGALPEPEFRRELSNKKKSEVLLTGEFRMGFETLRPDALQYEGLRKLTDEDLVNPLVIPPGQKIEYRALTDDKSFSKKQNTRIYPTMRDIDGNTVIVDGRFKGFNLDDMVNKVGRLVEGAAYDVDASGIPVPFETRDWEGNLTDVSANKEPYVTLDSKGNFLIKIPYMQGGGGKKDPFRVSREKMQTVSSKAPKKNSKGELTGGRTKGTSIVEVPDTQKTTYTFDAKDFATVRASVGGMVMSSEAAKKLRAYYEQMARQEDAVKAESLKSYSLDRIGGFKVEPVIDPETGEPFDPPKLTKDLLGKQKEALSWIESKGYKGLAALDTGVGKTLLAIATMQKMTRDGAAGEGSRFLYVCPKKLKGNLPRELKAWMTDEAAAGLAPRVDVVSYEEFVGRRNGGSRVKRVQDPITGKMVTVKDPLTGKSVTEKVAPDATFGMDPPYAAVFFDEAQALVKNENSKVSRAAQTLNHPRKILLTASPMEDDPDELYVGIAITNNTVVASGGQGKLTQARKDLIAFRKRFCVRVAGRTVGIKSDSEKDPTARQDFMAWAKSGMYFANKLEVAEENLKLQKPVRQPVSLTMDPAVEAEYKTAAKGVAKVLKALVGVYRDNTKPPAAQRQQVEAYQKALSGYMAVLNALSNYPDEVIDPKTGQPKFPGAVSPKVTASSMLVGSKIEGGKRTLLFTDDPKFAEKSAKQISEQVPGHRVAVALAGKILVFQDGEHKNPKENTFTQRIYTDRDGNKVPKDQWATFVLREVIGGDPSIVALVLTKTYALGQNLQMFSTVVHLDRDSFSNEMMKQRLARAWRTGQKGVVEEYTMDAVYDAPAETRDPTVDEVRKAIQESQEGVFDSIVHESRNAVIGQEWREMGNISADLVAVNRKMFELAMAPFPAALGKFDYEQSVKDE